MNGYIVQIFFCEGKYKWSHIEFILKGLYVCWVKSIKQCIVFVVLIHLGLVFGRDIAFFCSHVVYLEI